MPRTRRLRNKSAMVYVLTALLPYTEANLKLSFAPRLFFQDLEAISWHKKKTLQAAFYRAEKLGYIRMTGKVPALTQAGVTLARPFAPQLLGSQAKLMIIFDIPEGQAAARRQLRIALRAWQFTQVQRSVWVTKYDHRQSVVALIDELDIQSCVKLYESLELL